MDGIKLVNVDKFYNVEKECIKVLNGINLDIPKNKITVILGRSGCGKTTLLRLVAGLESFEQGDIQGANLKKAYVFQEDRLMPWLDVKKNITFGIKKKEIDDKKIDKIIETANNQVKDIKLIESIGGMDLLDDKTRLAATYRMKYKEASLLELSEIISIETKTSITKSGLHHRFTKIKQIANKIRNNE